MKKAMTVLGLGAAAVAISVCNASAMENSQTTTTLNLREDPSATSKKVTELNSGQKLTVVEKKNGWANVKTSDGKTGWVSGYYVSDENGDNINNIKKSGENSANPENQNFKNEIENKKIDNIDNNVNRKDSQYVNKSENNVSNIDSTDLNSNGKIESTSFLNIRKGPSISNDVKGKIYKNEIFKVVSRASNGWYKVILNDGTEGWASGNYITLTNEKDKSNLEIANNNSNNSSGNNYGRVNSSVGLNVRSGTSTNTSVITALPSNAKVNIIGEDNGWYKIKLSNGQIGYVGASFIDTDSSVSFDKSSSDNSNIKFSARDSETKTKSGSSSSVVKLAESLLGTKYVWGGSSTSGFDCSGFTKYVYKNALGIDIPRVSSAQASAGTAVKTNNLKQGDLLYFDTVGSGRTSHVGIYIGNGRFIHASGTSSNPEYVKISNLNENWVNCLGARRF